MRRFGFALAVAAIVAAGSAPAATAATTLASVSVFAPGANPTTGTVTLETLLAKCVTFPEPSVAPTLDGLAFTFPSETWALDTVLTCGDGLSLAKGDSVVVARGGSGTAESPLSYPVDLVAPSSFYPSSLVPVILDGGDVEYYRPPRSPTDQNGSDHVADGSPIAITVDLGGPPLKVSISPSPATERLGATVSFAASVTDQSGNALSQTNLQYSWAIAGGEVFTSGSATAAGPATAVKFTTAGTYSLSLQVADSQGSGGADTISIAVGHNPGSKKSSNPGNGKRPTHNTGPSGHHGKHHAATSTGGGSPTTTTTTTTTTTSPPATIPTPTTAPTTTAAATAPRTTPLSPPPTLAPSSPLVAGELISDVTTLPAASSPLAHPATASSTTAPAIRRPAATSMPEIIGAALTVLILFALGAGRELGWRPRWRSLRFGG